MTGQSPQICCLRVQVLHVRRELGQQLFLLGLRHPAKSDGWERKRTDRKQHVRDPHRQQAGIRLLTIKISILAILCEVGLHFLSSIMSLACHSSPQEGEKSILYL